MTERQNMEAVLEAILFVATEPVSPDKILEVFAEREREAAAEALEAVLERYRDESGRGVIVDRAGGGLRLVSRPDLHGYLRRFFEVSGTNKLSMAALETLAIIAYRQPVTAPEIQELRSVSSSGVLKTLLERRLIRISGRKEVVGKPFLYSTTRDFLMHFGLANLKELPPLEQFEELFGGELEIGEADSPDADFEETVLREAAELEERESSAEDEDDDRQEELEEPEETAETAETPSNEETADDESAGDELENVEQAAVEEPVAEAPEPADTAPLETKVEQEVV